MCSEQMPSPSRNLGPEDEPIRGFGTPGTGRATGAELRAGAERVADGLGDPGFLRSVRGLVPSGEVVFLDHAAGSPVIPEVALRHPELSREFRFNPHTTHRYGESCRRAVLRATSELLRLLGLPEGGAEVVWTSGGTEADNLGCLGFLRAVGAGGCAVEATAHAAVLEPSRQWGRTGGGRCSEHPCEASGQVDYERASELVGPELALLSVLHVNNETGAVQDLGAAKRWLEATAPGGCLMVDAVQSLGKIGIPWSAAGIDLLAIGGRKIGGPPQVGALIFRKGVTVAPLLLGGGQQGALRPGTLDTVGILEFVLAVDVAMGRLHECLPRARELNALLRSELIGLPVAQTRILSPLHASPYILSFALPGYEGAVLSRALAEEGVVVGTGSACSAESGDTSHVLAAMGVRPEVARCALRVSFSHETSEGDVRRLVSSLADVLRHY